MSTSELNDSFNVMSFNDSLNLWSRFNYNLSRTFVWPLLTTRDALSAMIVNRTTSRECSLWKHVDRKWSNEQLLEHIKLLDEHEHEPVKFHDPSGRILNIDMKFKNSTRLDNQLLVYSIPKWCYVTTLSLTTPYDLEAADFTELYSTITRTAGPLTKLNCLTHLTLDRWNVAIEVDSLSSQLKTLVLPSLKSNSHIVPGSIPASVTLLDFHGPNRDSKIFVDYFFPSGCIPNSIKRLMLSSEGDVDWDNAPGIFPDQLEYLKIEMWNGDLPESQILFPASLTELTACSNYDVMAFYNAFPRDSKLQRIYVTEIFDEDGVNVPYQLPDHLSHVEFRPSDSEGFPVSRF